MKRKNNTAPLSVNQVKIEFTRKSITPFGGIATVVAKFLEAIQFRGWVESALPIREGSNNSKGIYGKVLAQFLTVLAGGFRFSHVGWWECGLEVLNRAFGVQWIPQSASTLTRFWNKVHTQAMAEEFAEAARRLVRTIVAREFITEDTLHLDSSVITRYGHQQGAKKGYNPKKPGRPSHHPVMAFLGCGYVINLWNRAGDAHAGQSAVDFFTQSVLSLAEGFRVIRVVCDSGFYNIEFIKHLEKEGYLYIIAAPISAILQRAIMAVKDWKPVAPGIEVGEFRFEHLDAKWDRPRRYVVVRQSISTRPKASGKQPSLFKQLDQWEDYRMSLMITNDEEAEAESIWRRYRPRANDENVIKNLKEGFGLASFAMDNFWATEACMVLNVLVFHNLIHYLNRNILNRKAPLQQLRTIRGKYFIIAAQLGKSAGYNVLRLAVRDRKLRAKLTYFLEQIALLSHRLNCIAIENG
jgi:hypothetical protein